MLTAIFSIFFISSMSLIAEPKKRKAGAVKESIVMKFASLQKDASCMQATLLNMQQKGFKILEDILMEEGDFWGNADLNDLVCYEQKLIDVQKKLENCHQECRRLTEQMTEKPFQKNGVEKRNEDYLLKKST